MFETTDFSSLPFDIVFDILQLLNVKELVRLGQVSSTQSFYTEALLNAPEIVRLVNCFKILLATGQYGSNEILSLPISLLQRRRPSYPPSIFVGRSYVMQSSNLNGKRTSFNLVTLSKYILDPTINSGASTLLNCFPGANIYFWFIKMVR